MNTAANNRDVRAGSLEPPLFVATPPGCAPEPAFDELARLSAQVCGTPFALINLIEAGRLQLKASHGIAPADVPRERAFCEYVSTGGGLELVMPDILSDDRFCDHPAVTAANPIRFYAGVPLLDAGGQVLGNLCVLDQKPHAPHTTQVQALRTLARQVVAQIELRRATEFREEKSEQLTLMAQALNASTDGIVITDARLPDNPVMLVNPAFERITGYSAGETIGRNCRFLLNGEHDQPSLAHLRAAIRKKQSCRVVLKNFRKDGRPFWNELHIAPVREVMSDWMPM